MIENKDKMPSTMAKCLSGKTGGLNINKEKLYTVSLYASQKLHYLAMDITANGNRRRNRLDIRLFKQQVTYIVTQTLKSTTGEIPYELHKSTNYFSWTKQRSYKITGNNISGTFHDGSLTVQLKTYSGTNAPTCQSG